MSKSTWLKTLCTAAVIAGALSITAPTQARIAGITTGYAKTYTYGGATCGEGTPSNWLHPGLAPAAPGYKTISQETAYMLTPAGQAHLADALSCLPADQRALVMAALANALKTPGKFCHNGTLPPGTFLQESSRRGDPGQPAIVVAPTNYSGPPLPTAICDLEVVLIQPQWIKQSVKHNADDGTTTYSGYIERVLDIRFVDPYKCGNLSPMFRTRLLVLHRHSIRMVPVKVGKIAKIGGQPVPVPINTFSFIGSWPTVDPVTGQPQATYTTPAMPYVVDSTGRMQLGYAPVGVPVKVQEVTPPNGWIAVDGDNKPVPATQTLTASNKELDFGFTDNLFITGCACSPPIVNVSPTQAAMVNIMICGYYLPITADEVHVTMVSATTGSAVLQADTVTSSAGLSVFTAKYLPTTPGDFVIKVVVTDTATGWNYTFPDIPVHVQLPG